MLAFPGILLAIVIVAILGVGLTQAMLAIGIVSIPIVGRITRGNTLAWSEREFVLAARLLGTKTHRIIWREVLPNVLPAKPTTGGGPFGNGAIDTGPYGLTWGADKALYVGNAEANGDFMRVDLTTLTKTPVATFPARIVATTVFDRQRLLVATEGGKVFTLMTATGVVTPWVTLAGDVTSLARDRFTGRVFAEVRGSPPEIVEIDAGVTTGKLRGAFQKPPRLGRIAIAPDGEAAVWTDALGRRHARALPDGRPLDAGSPVAGGAPGGLAFLAAGAVAIGDPDGTVRLVRPGALDIVGRVLEGPGGTIHDLECWEPET
jgi:hypothetical protein